MARSLKEQFEAKRLNQVTERARRADAQIINEVRVAQLLVEAMDEEDLNKVTQIIQKLSTLKTPDLPKLKAAIEQAEAEINKYTAGGPLTKAWSKMWELIGIDNPIVKVTTFADALERGFAQIPQILKNNGVDLKGADQYKSLAQALGRLPTATKSNVKKPNADKDWKNQKHSGKNVPYRDTAPIPRPIADKSEGVVKEDDSNDVLTRLDAKMDSSSNSKSPDFMNSNKPDTANNKAVDEKVKSIADQLQKALSPGGIFGAFKKVPYIDSAELAQELVRAPLRVFSQVAKRVQQGTKAAEIAPDIKDQVQAQGGAETKGTDAEEPAQATSQTQPSQPAKAPVASTDSTETGQQTAKPQGGGAALNLAKATQKVKQAIAAARAKSGGLDIEAFTKKLVDAGMDPEKL